MSALILWINIPLMTLAFGLWVGVPLWLVLRRPAENRSVPAYLLARQQVVHARQPARGYASRRGLASM
jgi:hypothetical protein